MLTDLTFLQPGAAWPPPSEKPRIDGYLANRRLFEAEHAEVFKTAFERIKRDLGEPGASMVSTSFEVVLNYPKLLSVTTAGLLFNAAPRIVAGVETDATSMGAVQAMAERSDLQAALYACAIDVSRYGTGLLYVRRDDAGEGVIDITRPDVWFPVVDPANLRRVLYHTLATPYELVSAAGAQPRRYLRVEIHERGRITTRDYALDGGRIGAQVGTDQVEQTGLDDFAVIPIHNLLPSDRVYGIDDYEDIQSLVCELEVRVAQIARVLDKHSDPTMQGPVDALTDVQMPDGSMAQQFVPGRFYVNQAGERQGRIEYTVWDAQLEANFKLIDKLMEAIRTVSEMGALLTDLSEKGGQIPSGAAMRRMLNSAIGKVNRIRNAFTPAIIRAVRLCSQLSGPNLTGVPVYIQWADSLPRDPLEMAQVANLRTGGKQTQSVKRAIMALDDLGEPEAEAELEAIAGDQMAAMPPIGDATAGDEGEDDAQ